MTRLPPALALYLRGRAALLDHYVLFSHVTAVTDQAAPGCVLGEMATLDDTQSILDLAFMLDHHRLLAHPPAL
jgi:hypothetical protein